MIRWGNEPKPTSLPLPALPLQDELPERACPEVEKGQDEEYEMSRLRVAARVVMFDNVHGRTPIKDFARRLRGALQYMREWRSQPHHYILARARKGQCAEVPGNNVCMPWEPQTAYEWHPNLIDSLREKMLADKGERLTR